MPYTASDSALKAVAPPAADSKVPRFPERTAMAPKPVIDSDIKGVRVVSFPRDGEGMCNLDQVRTFFANDFLGHVAGIRRLVIDLNGVASLDSSCLGPLVQKMREIKEQGGRLALVGVNAPALQEIFALTRFDKVFPIYKDPAEALQTF
jgi:anti-anti-sigma factor